MTLFISVYLFIFLAELPDKTAFAALLMAARGAARPIFVGVAFAFFVQTAVAVLFGGLISLLPEEWVRALAGILFLIFAVQMYRSRNESDASDSDEAAGAAPVGTFWREAGRAFWVIFVAEWGDLTQLATASLVAKNPEHKFTVFWAALLALWSVTALAVVLGQKLKVWIQPRRLKTLCAVIFAGLGIYFLAGLT